MTRLNSVATAFAAAALLASSFVSADHHGGAHTSSITKIDSNEFGIDAKEIADINAQNAGSGRRRFYRWQHSTSRQ